jgi:hypothetical protein
LNDQSLSAFIWSVADLLRGDYKQSDYGKVILPFTVLRRLDCVLEPTKAAVRAEKAAKEAMGLPTEPFLLKAAGQTFYNTSPMTLAKLLGDANHVRQNLISYVQGFSPAVRDIFERFDFVSQVERLAKNNLLYLIVEKFTAIDLHPAKVPNSAMGHVFEELIRKFAELSNETAGEHFTPRDVIRLMVNLIFVEDDDALTKPGVVRSIYDPTAGTGGMLSTAGERLTEMNPQARLNMFGQELNDESYAICKADMLIKGQDVGNIVAGNTLSEDGQPPLPDWFIFAIKRAPRRYAPRNAICATERDEFMDEYDVFERLEEGGVLIIESEDERGDRWFDPWLCAKGKPLKALVESFWQGLEFHTDHTKPRARARRTDDAETHRAVMEALVANLAMAWLDPPPKGARLAMPLRKGTKRNRYENPELSTRMIRTEIEKLKELQAIALKIGNRGETTTTIFPSQWFGNRIQDHGVTLSDIGRRESEEVIVLIRGSLCPLMALTSGIDRPCSKNRLMASWRRSWKWRSSIPARFLRRSQASLTALPLIVNTTSSPSLRVWCSRMASAGALRGTVRESPFLVRGKCAVRA